MRVLAIVTAILLLLSCGNSSRARDEGSEVRVVRVVDGDTIVVRSDRGEERIRLLGIDAPEMNYGRGRPECGAREATAALRARIEGRTIGLERHGLDDYRRTLGIIFDGAPEDPSVNESLLREGHAEVFRKARHPRRGRFLAASRDAERARLGIWACRGR